LFSQLKELEKSIEANDAPAVIATLGEIVPEAKIDTGAVPQAVPRKSARAPISVDRKNPAESGSHQLETYSRAKAVGLPV
jgi:hypothetical protein